GDGFGDLRLNLVGNEAAGPTVALPGDYGSERHIGRAMQVAACRHFAGETGGVGCGGGFFQVFGKAGGDVALENPHSIDVGITDTFYAKRLDSGHESTALVLGASQLALTDNLRFGSVRSLAWLGAATGTDRCLVLAGLRHDQFSSCCKDGTVKL